MDRRGVGGRISQTRAIGEDEVSYLKSMKDQAELAKFDDYVETYIDPRQPGNMKWLMTKRPERPPPSWTCKRRPVWPRRRSAYM